MLVYVEPPINRDLWVFDVHLNLWLVLAMVWAAVADKLPASRFRVSPIIFAILDVVMTAEMDSTYAEMSRTAVTIRGVLSAALVASFM